MFKYDYIYTWIDYIPVGLSIPGYTEYMHIYILNYILRHLNLLKYIHLYFDKFDRLPRESPIYFKPIFELHRNAPHGVFMCFSIIQTWVWNTSTSPAQGGPRCISNPGLKYIGLPPSAPMYLKPGFEIHRPLTWEERFDVFQTRVWNTSDPPRGFWCISNPGLKYIGTPWGGVDVFQTRVWNTSYINHL